MILRSRFHKPSEVKIRKRQMGCGKNKQKKSTASQIPVNQETTCKNQNLRKSSSSEAYQHRDRKQCYILTRDSKTLRFDLDEHGDCKISVEDSQSSDDIAWLDIFTSNEQNNCVPMARNSTKKHCKNLVTMTQRSKNNFLLLGKNKKQLYLKVLNPNGKASRRHMVAGHSMEGITGGAPDLRQLTEKKNQLFIMHYKQEDSVRFQCYTDKNYYLHVNKDSVDLCKMKETDADTGKDFYFKVEYV
ncbi:uncharacterized protein LOC115653405 [Gopherus evgoodei]|uniref:uncharacterized protein LOC115653405 n=1 Tax=Gopherus evgoodei TaxID=1825980 RepID=UPI0011CF5C12|nr:uncharacterized protein LOC115653405 [Gopherus evgoodei]XP_030422548.1 uncharacterized protein LOC115653405 [Gopherus evgoodei]XP_030422549.1 uncharacterized protein LOC115653405 [Gopherus evgoodei]